MIKYGNPGQMNICRRLRYSVISSHRCTNNLRKNKGSITHLRITTRRISSNIALRLYATSGNSVLNRDNRNYRGCLRIRLPLRGLLNLRNSLSLRRLNL